MKSLFPRQVESVAKLARVRIKVQVVFLCVETCDGKEARFIISWNGTLGGLWLVYVGA